MTVDSLANFAYSTVFLAPFPPTTGTNLTIQAGDTSKFPTAPFNIVVWPSGEQPLSSNAEIMRVTSISNNTFTVERAQENTTNKAIAVGYQVAQNITAGLLQEIISNSTLPNWFQTGSGDPVAAGVTPVASGTLYYDLGGTGLYFSTGFTNQDWAGLGANYNQNYEYGYQFYTGTNGPGSFGLNISTGSSQDPLDIHGGSQVHITDAHSNAIFMDSNGVHIQTNGSNPITFYPPLPVASGTNATKLQSIPISTTAPTDGQFLAYSESQWVPQTISISGGTISGNYLSLSGGTISGSLTVASGFYALDGSGNPVLSVDLVNNQTSLISNNIAYIAAPSVVIQNENSGSTSFIGNAIYSNVKTTNLFSASGTSISDSNDLTIYNSSTNSQLSIPLEGRIELSNPGGYITLYSGGDIYLNSQTGGVGLVSNYSIGLNAPTILSNGDFIPNSDNTFTLGSPSNRWKSLYVGSGTIFITDVAFGTQAALTVNSGIFNINGVVQAQLPQIIASGITTNSLVASGYVTTSGLNANSITFSDGTTQISANNTRYRTVTVTGSSTVVLDMSKDNTVLVNINQGTLNITLSGLTANRTTDLLVKYGTTGGAQVNTGVSTSSNSSNGGSFYLPSHPFSRYKYYCVDGTLSNTFVVGTIS